MRNTRHTALLKVCRSLSSLERGEKMGEATLIRYSLVHLVNRQRKYYDCFILRSSDLLTTSLSLSLSLHVKPCREHLEVNHMTQREGEKAK